jgi:hypothetical protein
VRERARAAYQAGQEAYAAAQYAAAAAHFEQADTLLPAVQAKYWRATSLDRAGDVAAAYAAFNVLLADPHASDLGPEKLQAATLRQRALATVPADLSVTTVPAGAHLQVSGVEIASPTPVTLRIAPGRHVLVVSLPGYDTQRLEISATPGAKLTPSLTLSPITGPAGLAAVPPEPLAQTGRSRVPGYVTIGIAGASAIVGTIFGVRALQDKSDFNAAPSTRKADDTERDALIADMAWGVTLTLGITGAVLLLTNEAPSPTAQNARQHEQAGLRVLPYLSPKGAGAAAALRF